MKWVRGLGWLLLFLSLQIQTLWANPLSRREFNVRFSNQFGLIGRIYNEVMGSAVRTFVFLNPELALEYQIGGAWFATASFAYAYLRGQHSDHLDLYAPTGGIKWVGFEDTPYQGDFFDKTRWWFGVQVGPYYSYSRLAVIIPRGKAADFGFNISGGFDVIATKHWAPGFQVKMHYVHFGPDDFLLTTFGPHLVFRF